MEYMKVKYLKLKNWLLITLMGALGFGACHTSKKVAEPEAAPEPPQMRDEPVRLMYGVPTMHYEVRGQVRDTKGKPVRDVRVNMLERNMDIEGTQLVGDAEAISNWLEKTEVRTDKEGRFELKTSGLPQEQVRLLVRDADGKANGNFRDQVVEMEVAPSDVDRSQASGWDQGVYKKDVKVKMEKK